MSQYLFAVIDEHFRYLIALGIFIANGAYLAVIEAEDSCFGITEKNRRMSYYDELRIVLHAFGHFKQQRQLSLRRQCCFGLVEDVQTIRIETILNNFEEAFTVGLFVEFLRWLFTARNL